MIVMAYCVPDPHSTRNTYSLLVARKSNFMCKACGALRCTFQCVALCLTSVDVLVECLQVCAPVCLYRYSGWGPGQLDGECQRGVWFAVAASPEVILSDPQKGDGLWHSVVSVRHA